MIRMIESNACLKLSFIEVVHKLISLDKTYLFTNKNGPMYLIHSGLTMDIRNDKSYPKAGA